jgi:hypothetical protein
VAAQPITPRELNRATLARQFLLTRERRPVLDAIAALAGLQAQNARDPFVGLWTRLEDFRREELLQLIHTREVTRATLMRATLHLVTTADYERMRPLLQHDLVAEWRSVRRRAALEPDVPEVLAAAESFFAEPHTFAEFRPLLEALKPGRQADVLAYAVRTHLPLAEMPDAKAAWGFAGNAPFRTAESWLGRPLGATASPRDLVLRYLAAFGPASAADVRAWSGMTSQRVREAFDGLRSELVVLPGQRGALLFDLPDAPRPAAETPVPPRLLPGFDNLLFAWRDRSRVMSEEHRRRLSAPPLMHPSLLLDGFVAGDWRIEEQGGREKAGSPRRRGRSDPGGRVRMVIGLFHEVSKFDQEAVVHEAERLLRFLKPDALAYAVDVLRS